MRYDEALESARRAVGRDDLELSLARPDEYDAVEALSRGADSRDVQSPLTARQIAWFVDHNPAGPGFVVLARDRATRELAGHFVFYRWDLVRRGGDGGVVPLPAWLYVRLYVAAAFRRRGVFAAMTAFGLAVLEHSGAPFAYTAPNPRSSPGFVKFGMRSLGPLPFYMRPALSSASATAASRGLEIERRSAFDDRPGRLVAEGLPDATRVWSPRTAAALNWRYTERPEAEYEIRYVSRGDTLAGYLVTRRMTIKGRRVLVLCDWWAQPSDSRPFRTALRDALGAGDPVRLAMAVGGTSAPASRRALWRAGFVRFPPQLLPQPIVILGGGVGPEGRRVELPEAREWFLTPVDWDVF